MMSLDLIYKIILREKGVFNIADNFFAKTIKDRSPFHKVDNGDFTISPEILRNNLIPLQKSPHSITK